MTKLSLMFEWHSRKSQGLLSQIRIRFKHWLCNLLSVNCVVFVKLFNFSEVWDDITYWPSMHNKSAYAKQQKWSKRFLCVYTMCTQVCVHTHTHIRTSIHIINTHTKPVFSCYVSKSLWDLKSKFFLPQFIFNCSFLTVLTEAVTVYLNLTLTV